MAEQNFSNHTRWFPLVHFVVFPLLALNLLSHLVRLVMSPSWTMFFWTVLAVTLVLMALAARQQALRAQDRLIRLEERLRYKEVLPAELAARASGLKVGQIIALRFASDEELADLVGRTLKGEFATTKDIKRAVKNWRADHLRV